MSNRNILRLRVGAACLCALTVFHSGCASRMVLVDDKGQAISRNEVAAKKSSRNLWLYTLGGGALSFGASFFVGSMVDRGLDSEDHTALWAITAVGTAVGTAIFAHNGNVRDFNQAVETVKDDRQGKLDDEIAEEKKKQDALAEERRKLEDERKRQEREREELLKKIRDKQSKEKDPE